MSLSVTQLSKEAFRHLGGGPFRPLTKNVAESDALSKALAVQCDAHTDAIRVEVFLLRRILPREEVERSGD